MVLPFCMYQACVNWRRHQLIELNQVNTPPPVQMFFGEQGAKKDAFASLFKQQNKWICVVQLCWYPHVVFLNSILWHETTAQLKASPPVCSDGHTIPHFSWICFGRLPVFKTLVGWWVSGFSYDTPSAPCVEYYQHVPEQNRPVL